VVWDFVRGFVTVHNDEICLCVVVVGCKFLYRKITVFHVIYIGGIHIEGL
jgi:hypothetical protein